MAKQKDIEYNEPLEFVPIGFEPPSSPTAVPQRAELETPGTHDAPLSPLDRILALPVLPKLENADRSRLLMQSPTRLYFYWSLGSNPLKVLNEALGSDIGSYRLVIRLVDQTRDAEQIFPCEHEGSTWFDADPATKYRAEVGFYAPNRPFVRVTFSNDVETPRRSPSPQTSDAAEWQIPAHQFARVLDASGFKQDAFDVALAGDDHTQATGAAVTAMAEFTQLSPSRFAGINPNELRHSLFSFAAGATLEDIRFQITPRLFSILQEDPTRLNQEAAVATAKKKFNVDASDLESEEFETAFLGSSFMHSPRKMRFSQVPGSTARSPLYK